MKKALTIAGTDSGGGAGVLADIKTFASFGVHGMAAITSVTAQNTLEVRAINDLPPNIVEQQIKAVADDIGVDAAKTGMLSNAEIIKSVAGVVKKYGFPLVVDPVMIAKSGAILLKEDAIETLIKYLIPNANLITPNRMEAEKLSNMEIKSIDDAIKSAEKISSYGIEYVLIKGGHLKENEAIDILYHNGEIKKYSKPWYHGCTHGTGCSYSAAITANLAKGYEMEKAIEIAKEFITMGIKYGIKIGKGHCPVNQNAYIHIPAERWNAYISLKRAVASLLLYPELYRYIPEVGMNFAYSLPKEYSFDARDVVAIEGRIVKAGKKARVGEIKFGGSQHLAKAIFKAMEFNESIRSVMNIKYDKKIIKKAEENLIVSFYDRNEEPKDIKEKEGETIPWGIENAIKKAKKMPDVIYHEGDIGKEPMILIFGKEPAEVLKKFGILTVKYFNTK